MKKTREMETNLGICWGAEGGQDRIGEDGGFRGVLLVLSSPKSKFRLLDEFCPFLLAVFV